MTRYFSRRFTPADVIEHIDAPSHICLVYDEISDYRHVAFAYIRDGLDHHEKCIMATDVDEPHLIDEDFSSHGMRLKGYTDSGQLTLLNVHASYSGEDGFEPQKTIDIWRKAVQQAQTEGYHALRVVGEATFALKSPELKDKLLCYENLLNQDIFPHYPMSAMCVYDKARYSSRIIKAVIKAHPVLIHNRKIYHHNVYYVPPEIFFGERRNADEIDRWLENVDQNNAAIEALHDSEKRYRDMIDFLPVPVGEYDLDFKDIYANQAAFDCFGYTKEDLPGGVSLLDLVPEAERDRVMERMQRLARGDNPGPLELPLRKKDGSLIYGQTFPAPVIRNGQVVAVRICFQDLTERRRKELDRQRLEARLRHAQKMEAIGTLAGGIAHDFNNILASIIGFAELALDEAEKTSPLHEDLLEIHKAGNRAKDLVRQILTIGRQEQQEMRPFHLIPLVKEALKMLRATIPASIAFHPHFCDHPLVIKGDPTQIHQIVVNLITNAAQAMHDNCGTLEITIAPLRFDESMKDQYPGMQPGQYVRLTVSDNGIGIPKEHQEKIFEPYFSTRKQKGGTGLGLSVVHSIVQAHQGLITVYSEPGSGTTFHVYFPLARRLMPDALKAAVSSLPRGNEHLLVVDDEPSIVKMLRLILEQLGYAITATTSSKEALNWLRASPYSFDMIITDKTMPDMTGDRLACEIKKIRSDLPVILCTGYTQKNAPDEKSPAVDKFLNKPVDKHQLAATVRNLLDRD